MLYAPPSFPQKIIQFPDPHLRSLRHRLLDPCHVLHHQELHHLIPFASGRHLELAARLIIEREKLPGSRESVSKQ